MGHSNYKRIQKLKKSGPAKEGMEQFESCHSCKSSFKNPLTHERMCIVNQTIETKTHINQNGHVNKTTVAVRGTAPCSAINGGGNKCKKYSRHPGRALRWRKRI